MESSEMNQAGRDDAAFVELFRAAATPLTDDGFTSRVLAALPPPACARFDVRFFVWALIGALVGASVALANDVTSGFRELVLATSPLLDAATRLDPRTVFALLLTTMCVALTGLALRHRELWA